MGENTQLCSKLLIMRSNKQTESNSFFKIYLFCMVVIFTVIQKYVYCWPLQLFLIKM